MEAGSTTVARRTHSPAFSARCILAGGPGQAAITTDFLALLAPLALGQILVDRDIVLLEQRGTRNTSVHLGCPQLGSSE